MKQKNCSILRRTGDVHFVGGDFLFHIKQAAKMMMAFSKDNKRIIIRTHFGLCHLKEESSYEFSISAFKTATLIE